MTHPSPAPLRIGTRRSALALRQSEMVRDALAALGAASVLVTFDTVGDLRLDRALSALGEKGAFTAELESALRAGEVDLCVHSLKDLPTVLPADIGALATPPREDPRDVLIVRAGVAAASLAELPPGARVGTCSLRRRAQLGALRPDLDVRDLRGNVQTRLRRLDEGEHDAILLAAAGLRRLGLHERITAALDAPWWLPAPGQGAIAVQARAGDPRTGALLAALHHAPTASAVRAERALLNALDGGCQVPIGALAAQDGDAHVLHGLVASLDGSRLLRGAVPMDPRDPEAGGRTLAALLRAEGADAILRQVRADRTPALVGAEG
ncbi:hydroxymethylbilane synthase [Roseisolibacter sp. H3M3-2]|uniref:hydroxymethylbilane synthase n=1 Tax=Roseisolibacter sp. H3M3-2 TaxID=3031323 RepID=UPI0023DC53C4|nr:hydroxymethylbilane synthase [Roseisolibacter sp. H3M3-2]MDF1501357.1 hydroxymethylbilane synthase [Roseisolibacter sp. H3M3-2]